MHICTYYQVTTIYVCADNQGKGDDNRQSTSNTEGQGQGSSNDERQVMDASVSEVAQDSQLGVYVRMCKYIHTCYIYKSIVYVHTCVLYV